VYGRYKQGGTMTASIQADVLGAPLDQTIELKLPDQEASNPEIERMWASHRVDKLMAADRERGSVGSTRDEIVRLCEGYSIVSEYASFIVLENDAEYKRWSIERRNATRVERDRSSQLALRRQLEQLRDRAAANLGPSRDDTTVTLAAANPLPTEASQTTNNASPTNATPSRGRDLDMPSSGNGGGRRFGGGGAIDPVTGAVALVLAGAAICAARRKRRQE
jgi:hypothetical protein